MIQMQDTEKRNDGTSLLDGILFYSAYLCLSEVYLKSCLISHFGAIYFVAILIFDDLCIARRGITKVLQNFGT